jgi:DNA modification methylase
VFENTGSRSDKEALGRNIWRRIIKEAKVHKGMQSLKKKKKKKTTTTTRKQQEELRYFFSSRHRSHQTKGCETRRTCMAL